MLKAESQQHQDDKAKLQRALAEQAGQHREREAELGIRVNEMENRLAVEQTTRSTIEGKVEALNARLCAAEDAERAAKQRLATRLFFALLVMLSLGALAGAAYCVHRIWPLLIWNHRRISVAVALVWITVCAAIGSAIGNRFSSIRSAGSFTKFVEFRKWWIASFLGGAAASLVSSALQWW